MNKKYLLLFVGVIVIFIIFVVVIFFQQNPPLPQFLSPHNQNPVALQEQKQAPSVSLAPPSSNPKAAAKQFYDYYFSTDNTPLAGGAYKNNPYLSQDFKDTIGDLYNNGNAPVFCSQNKRTNVTVGKEQQMYYNNQYLTIETISDAANGKALYSISLENVNGKWLIFDVNCIY